MCELDPIPVDLLKQAQDGLLPTLTEIVNLSLGTATFAKSWKVALIKPLLQKIGLELIKSNCRPVNSLCFISKLVEKCAMKRFNHHCETNSLMPDYRSAYRNNYSCETALLKYFMICYGTWKTGW